MMSWLQPAMIIWYRDLRLFLNDRAQIVGAVAQPLLYLLAFGYGFSPAMSRDLGVSYLAFLFPGMVGITVLFTAISSALSLTWDRQFGFLREVLVSPIPRTAIAVGKLLGGISKALFQGCLILASAPFFGIPFPWASLPKVLLIMLLGAAALNLLGLALAARIQSMQGFQAIISLLSMPMFLLSGAFFPLDLAPPWMRSLAIINPFTYAIDGLRTAMGIGHVLFPYWIDAGMLGSMTVLLLLTVVWAFSRPD